MSDKTQVKIEASWLQALSGEFEKPYFQQIRKFLHAEKAAGRVIFPPGPQIFNAFDQTPLEKVKVVILGQDPYHGQGQAMGLCFSVPRGIPQPASLKNIFKELQNDLQIQPPAHGDLSGWARQGVFLLNSILTVEQAKAGSHSRIGWQIFTDTVIRTISEQCRHVVFLLWGNYARSKKDLIDPAKHLILESVHPSPLSGGGFFGNHHFSKTNQYLMDHGLEPIHWEQL